MTVRSSNRIVLRDLRMNACIGVHAWEMEAPQPVRLDLEFDLPQARACRSDDLADTVDYMAVVACLRSLALSRPHRLVEAMAESMCNALHQRFGLTHIRLSLIKLAAIARSEVGITVEREWPQAAGAPNQGPDLLTMSPSLPFGASHEHQRL